MTVPALNCSTAQCGLYRNLLDCIRGRPCAKPAPDALDGNSVSEKPAHFDGAASVLYNIGLHTTPSSASALRLDGRCDEAEDGPGGIADECDPIAVCSFDGVAQDRAAIQFDLRHGRIDIGDLEIGEPPHAGMNGSGMVGLHQACDFLVAIQEDRVAVLRIGRWPLLILCVRYLDLPADDIGIEIRNLLGFRSQQLVPPHVACAGAG